MSSLSLLVCYVFLQEIKSLENTPFLFSVVKCWMKRTFITNSLNSFTSQSTNTMAHNTTRASSDVIEAHPRAHGPARNHIAVFAVLS